MNTYQVYWNPLSGYQVCPSHWGSKGRCFIGLEASFDKALLIANQENERVSKDLGKVFPGFLTPSYWESVYKNGRPSDKMIKYFSYYGEQNSPIKMAKPESMFDIYYVQEKFDLLVRKYRSRKSVVIPDEVDLDWLLFYYKADQARANGYELPIRSYTCQSICLYFFLLSKDLVKPRLDNRRMLSYLDDHSVSKTLYENHAERPDVIDLTSDAIQYGAMLVMRTSEAAYLYKQLSTRNLSTNKN